jgi:uncharacterized protein (TIGR00730 family)
MGSDMTIRKKVPHLRSIAQPERSNAVKARGSWQVMGIISEFVEATEKLADIRPAVSIFGSARIKAGMPWYERTLEVSRMLSDAGFAVISGGGPGIMEAANRGAHEMGMLNVGLNIALPHEQSSNPYVSPSLNFKFHYFALRKMHFMMRAKALVAFPGGYGTLDELFEIITLVQTQKERPVPIILFGSDYWKKLVNFELMVEMGTVHRKDLDLLTFCDTPQEAWDTIRACYRLS